MTMRFYRTKITIEVLSQGELGDCLSLDQVVYAISNCPCVGGNMTQQQVELTPKQMADALYEFGSEPSFFMLDDDGKLTESYE